MSPYRRDNLVMPSLDRLRDLVAQGELHRLYLQCPDRLAMVPSDARLETERKTVDIELKRVKGPGGPGHRCLHQ